MKKEFYNQLDGLRAIAVIGVMLSHWVFLPFIKKLGLGFWGVNLFFVLSGFLITEILLKQIHRKDSTKNILMSFYLKRSLRIFPIYYLIVALAYIFNLDGSREITEYTLTYTLNFYNAISGNEGSYLSHLWSLCVEEQFYLIWPFLLLLVNRKYHLHMIISIIFASVGFRFVLTLAEVNNYSIYNYRIMPASLDALGLGALIAYLKLFKQQTLRKILQFQLVPIIALSAYIFLSFSNSFHLLSETLLRFSISVCCFFIVGKAVFGFSNTFGKLLEVSFIQHLGRISYGLYLYHLLVSTFLEKNIREIASGNLPAFLPEIVRYNLYIIEVPINFSFTFLIAMLSYRFIETPFLRLKDKIDQMQNPYTKQKKGLRQHVQPGDIKVYSFNKHSQLSNRKKPERFSDVQLPKS